MMPLDDFLDFFYAKLRKFQKAAEEGKAKLGAGTDTPEQLRIYLRLVSEARIFHLGDEEGITNALKTVGRDAMENVRAALPMPFQNLLLVWQDESLGQGWTLDWFYQVAQEDKKNGLLPRYCYANFHEKSLNSGELQSPVGFTMQHHPDRDWTDFDTFEVVFRTPSAPPPNRKPPSREFKDRLIPALGGGVARCAVVSHPYHFLVEARPTLKPRDVRIQKKQGHIPDRKRPRFIVVDYSGLEDLRSARPTGATPASPVPHHRRGHWRRLAERCQGAREEGKSRVWVRPTIVGDTQFAKGSVQYKVILDQPTEAKLHGSSGKEGLD